MSKNKKEKMLKEDDFENQINPYGSFSNGFSLNNNEDMNYGEYSNNITE
jgi:hypothetical protein